MHRINPIYVLGFTWGLLSRSRSVLLKGAGFVLLVFVLTWWTLLPIVGIYYLLAAPVAPVGVETKVIDGDEIAEMMPDGCSYSKSGGMITMSCESSDVAVEPSDWKRWEGDTVCTYQAH